MADHMPRVGSAHQFYIALTPRGRHRQSMFRQILGSGKFWVLANFGFWQILAVSISGEKWNRK
jgi:hypothetical protein